MQKFRIREVSVDIVVVFAGFVVTAALSYGSRRSKPAGRLVRRGKYQVSDQTKPSERARPRTQQSRAHLAEDRREEDARLGRFGRCSGNRGTGKGNLPGPRQGGLGRCRSQTNGGPPQVTLGKSRSTQRRSSRLTSRLTPRPSVLRLSPPFRPQPRRRQDESRRRRRKPPISVRDRRQRSNRGCRQALPS